MQMLKCMFGNQSPPLPAPTSTVWVPGIKLQLSGLVADSLRLTSPTFFLYKLIASGILSQ